MGESRPLSPISSAGSFDRGITMQSGHPEHQAKGIVQEIIKHSHVESIFPQITDQSSLTKVSNMIAAIASDEILRQGGQSMAAFSTTKFRGTNINTMLRMADKNIKVAVYRIQQTFAGTEGESVEELRIANSREVDLVEDIPGQVKLNFFGQKQPIIISFSYSGETNTMKMEGAFRNQPICCTAKGRPKSLTINPPKHLDNTATAADWFITFTFVSPTGISFKVAASLPVK